MRISVCTLISAATHDKLTPCGRDVTSPGVRNLVRPSTWTVQRCRFVLRLAPTRGSTRAATRTVTLPQRADTRRAERNTVRSRGPFGLSGYTVRWVG